MLPTPLDTMPVKIIAEMRALDRRAEVIFKARVSCWAAGLVAPFLSAGPF